MINRKLILLLKLIFGTLVLNGCSSMNSDFDCPMKPGVRCESIDKVNARVDRGELGKVTVPNYSKSSNTESFEYADRQTSQSSFADNENSMRIWIAPYTDKQGNYHEGTNVYANQNISDLA